MAGIKDIAKKANVSIGTVDRVLHNRGRVAESTAKKIREVAESLNYKPNLSARALVKKTPCNIGVLLPEAHQDNGYWQKTLTGLEQALETFGDYGVNILIRHYDRFNESSFKREAETLLKKNVGSLVCAPATPHPAKAFFESLEKVPFVFFDSHIPNTNMTCYIGQDSMQSGRCAGQLMSSILNEDERVLIIRTQSDDHHIVNRVNGFISFFKEISRENKITVADVPDDIAINQILNHLANQDIDIENYKGVFVTNSGAYKYANIIANKKDQPKIIGYDLIDENVSALEVDKITFLINQHPTKQTYLSVKTLVNLLVFGQAPMSKQVLLPIDIITKENLFYYVNQPNL